MINHTRFCLFSRCEPLRTVVNANNLEMTKLFLDRGAKKADIRKWNDVQQEMWDLLETYE